MRISAIWCLVGVASGATLKVTWSDCGDANTHGTVKDLEPPTIETGVKTTISGSGSVDIGVGKGTFHLVMKSGFIPLLDHTGDLCSAETINLPLGVGSIDWQGLNCPQDAGDVTLAMDMSLASSVPSALLHTTSTLTATDDQGNKLMCVTINTAAQDSALADASMEEDSEWFAFKTMFHKQYTSLDHERARYWIFKSNTHLMREHNSKQANYRLGVNEFSDLTADEFAESHFGFKKPAKVWPGLKKLGTHRASAGEVLASSVDWTTQGAVTPVKNQGQCGSCWSFSTTGALEGAWEIATGTLVSVSEQQFVDCSKQNSGCNGGLMDYAFAFAENTNLCTEASYSYTASDGSCHASGCDVAIPSGGVTGYKDVSHDENSLMSAVSLGPVSVAIEADKSVFQSYTSGVLTGNCGTQLDHGVLCVGYGTDGGQDYWKVKNSWGGSWGESGYVRMLRGKGGSGECGILLSASYPKVNGNAPPSPSPSPSPSPAPTPSCEDQSGICSLVVQFQLCNVFAAKCMESCGCCVADPPSFCPASLAAVVV